MNTTRTVLAVLAMAAGTVMAQTPPAGVPVKSLRVVETVLPVFPRSLVEMGVREGEVRIAFSVDANGRIDDCLPISYTHRAFADSAVAALKRWKFDPARLNEEPVAVATEVQVKFELEGTVVVSVNVTETIGARFQTLTDEDRLYRPRALKDLDRIPTPIAAPSPAFPRRLQATGAEDHVTVTFYIDEQGSVRLPSISSKDDPELGAIVISALRNWKFEPPMCKGRPVLVKASQQFNFRSPSS